MKSYEQTALAILLGKEVKTEENVEEVLLEETDLEEAMTHPMAVHVKEVPGKKVGGLPAYQVHKVGSQVKGIKVGEHLNDTHLDDLADMGHKIKMKEEAEMKINRTVIEHDSFSGEFDTTIQYNDFIAAARTFCESEEDVITIADKFYSTKDESLVLEAYFVRLAEEKINKLIEEGHEVSSPKYTMENDQPCVEYIVKEKETGFVTQYVHLCTATRV